MNKKAVSILIGVAVMGAGVLVHDELTISRTEKANIKSRAQWTALEERILDSILDGNIPQFNLSTDNQNEFIKAYVKVAIKLGDSEADMLAEGGEKRLYKRIRTKVQQLQ